MQLKEKKVLAAGMGKSGKAVIEALLFEGAKVALYDKKTVDVVDNVVKEMVKNNNLETYFGVEPENISDFDMLILSPGIPLDIELVKDAKKSNLEIIGELELSYLLSKGKFVAITGTNGKTTTTALVGEIFKTAKKENYVVGNIGVAAVSKAKEATKHGFMITEVSSFQLETIKEFHPIVAAVLNITEDHLNRHKTMEKYIEAKANIFKNQNEDDYFVVNKDSPLAYGMIENCKAKIIPFSRTEKLEVGAFVENDVIMIKDLERKVEEICKISDLKIPGVHNLENALAAVAIAYFSGIEAKDIRIGLQTFEGVEHRIELVGEINNIKFINDSKGTNPDASIKAVEAMDRPTILIAGGMDKGSQFEELIDAFKDKIKYLVLLGETAEKIKNTANEMGYFNVIIKKDLEECVNEAYKLADSGDTVLLSPACASWDMYPSFETRGQHFKDCFNALR